MKIRTILFLMLCAVFYAGAQDDLAIETTSMKVTTASGLVADITLSGSGPTAMPGDVVSVHYTGRLTDSTVFDSSIPRNAPISFKLGRGQVIRGWDEGIAMLRVGDKATFIIPPDLGYGAAEKGAIPANSTLIFDVELVDIKEGVRPYNVEGLDTVFTPEGIGVIFVKDDTATPVAWQGQTIKAHYSGFFLEGDLFDSSVERGQPFIFVLGKGMVISGWEIGFSLLSQGDQARLIIPYEFAYGEEGRASIPPRSDLVFDVEVLEVTDIKRPEPYDGTGHDTITTGSGLQIVKVLETEGDLPGPGTSISVHYVGYFMDGKVFDTSYDRGQPFTFPLGQQRVIRGWDEGFRLMKYGEKARFIIPYHLAYGETGYGNIIPAKANLIFDVYLLPLE